MIQTVNFAKSREAAFVATDTNPRKAWQAPVVIVETVDYQTASTSVTGEDGLVTPFTHS